MSGPLSASRWASIILSTVIATARGGFRTALCILQDIQVEDYLTDADELHEKHVAAGGDLIWSGAPFWGLPWVEAYSAAALWRIMPSA